MILPVYKSGVKIECLNGTAYGNFDFSYYTKEDNTVPAFVSDPIVSAVFTIADIQVCKVDTVALSGGILQVLPVLDIDNSNIDIKTITTGIYQFYLPEAFNTLITECGIYQCYITLSDGEVYYTDLFYLNGDITGGSGTVLTEDWIVILTESDDFIIQETGTEPKRVSELDTTTTTTGSYLYILIPDGLGGFLSKKILASSLAPTPTTPTLIEDTAQTTFVKTAATAGVITAQSALMAGNILTLKHLPSNKEVVQINEKGDFYNDNALYLAKRTSNIFLNSPMPAALSGTNNVSINAAGFTNVTSGSDNQIINGSGSGITGTSSNIAIGLQTLLYYSYSGRIAIGSGSGKEALGNFSTSLGYYAGNKTGANCLKLGYYAGAYTTTNDMMFLDGRNRTNTAGDLAKSLVVGKFADDVTNQWLQVNGYLFLSTIKAGATQAAASAAANEVWKTSGHATLPDNVLMIGV